MSDPLSTDASLCRCITGYYKNQVTNQCQICPGGFYCPDSNTLNLCGGAHLSSIQGSTKSSDCKCEEGYYDDNGSCKSCPAGFYCPFGSTSPTSCITNEDSIENAGNSLLCRCVIGYYGRHGSCNICPVGSYCPLRSTYPLSCFDNETTNIGSYNESDCTCIAGYYGTHESCNICTAGSYCPGGTQIIQCTNNTMSNAGATACTYCISDHFLYTNADHTACLYRYYLSDTNALNNSTAELIDKNIHPMAIMYSERLNEQFNINFNEGFDLNERMGGPVLFTLILELTDLDVSTPGEDKGYIHLNDFYPINIHRAKTSSGLSPSVLSIRSYSTDSVTYNSYGNIKKYVISFLINEITPVDTFIYNIKYIELPILYKEDGPIGNKSKNWNSLQYTIYTNATSIGSGTRRLNMKLNINYFRSHELEGFLRIYFYMNDSQRANGANIHILNGNKYDFPPNYIY